MRKNRNFIKLIIGLAIILVLAVCATVLLHEKRASTNIFVNVSKRLIAEVGALISKSFLKDTSSNKFPFGPAGNEGSNLEKVDIAEYLENNFKSGTYKIVEINVTIENQGKLATHVGRGSRLAGNREDAVWLIGDPGKITFLQGSAFQKIGVLEGQMKIPGYKASASSTARTGRQGVQRMNMPPGYPMQRMGQSTQAQSKKQTGPKREVKWLVAVEGNTPLKVVVTSQKGGTKVKELTIK